MLNPNLTAKLFAAGGFDKYGQAAYPGAGVDVPCAVVKFEPMVKKSAIRTTETASRAQADEELDPSILLFPASVAIKLGDKVLIFGDTLICKGVQRQFTLGGQVDFYECEFEAA